MEAILTIIAFLLVFGILVFVHELGHFLAAKLTGVAVHEFAIGFGPKVFSRKYKETEYTLRLFPLGGFVKPKGERGEKTPDKDAYINKPLLSKVFILVAGVVMNFILAVVLGAVYMSSVNYQVVVQNITDFRFLGPQVTTIPESLKVLSVLEGGPADGLIQSGDLIIGIDGQPFEDTTSLLQTLSEKQGELLPLQLVNVDDFSIYNIEVKLNIAQNEGDPILGVGFPRSTDENTGGESIPSFYVLNYPANVVSGFTYAWDMFWYQVAALGSTVSNAVSASDPSIVTDQLAGPVGILNIVGQIISAERIKELINLTVVLSLALAFFNILPIPILDGGQIVIEVVEKLRGRPFSETTMAILTYIGLGFFLLLFVVVMWKDLSQVGLFSWVIDIFRGAFGR